MNSPFSNIFLSLMERINTLTSGEPATPVVKYIDLDYGQLESKERPSVAFPCILIDFTGWQFSELGQLTQMAKGNISLKLATDPYDATSSITPLQYRQAGIYILELEWAIYRLLNGWSPSVVVTAPEPPAEPEVIQAAKPIIRASLTSDNRRPGLKVRELMFSCSFTDYSGKIAFTMLPAAPNIDAAFSFTLPV